MTKIEMEKRFSLRRERKRDSDREIYIDQRDAQNERERVTEKEEHRGIQAEKERERQKERDIYREMQRQIDRRTG